MTKFLNRTKLREFYGINDSAMGKFLLNGHPQPVKGRGFDLLASATWFSGRPGKGKAKEKALAYLATLAPAKPETEKPNAQVPPGPKRRAKKGIEQTVIRLRTEEEALHRAYKDLAEKNPAAAPAALRNWHASIDLLTRAEPALIKYKREMEELIDAAKYRKWLKERIAAAKSILLDLPSRVAPQCENMPWHQIQKLLDAEVRRALQKLSES